MQITHLTVQNFLGIADFRHAFTQPFVLIAGDNGVGKTSLLDAIRFALLGTVPRDQAKTRQGLVTEGAVTGFVNVGVDGWTLKRAIGSGKLSDDSDGPQYGIATALALSPHSFAALPDATRRQHLFEIAGVKVDRDTVAERLREAGAEEGVIEQVLPVLRSGFKEAADFARTMASEGRGAWKSVTGENYGSQKAATWTAATADADPAEAIDEQIARVDAAQQMVDECSLAKAQVESLPSPERIAAWRAEASALDVDAVESIGAALDEARVALSAAQAAGAAGGHTFDCPHCQTKLLLSEGVAVIAPPTKAKASPAKIEAAQKRVDTLTQELKAARVAQGVALAAKHTLENLPTVTADTLARAEQLTEARHHLDLHRQALRAMQERNQAASMAEYKTQKAADAHKAVAQWTLVQEQMSPDGIPAVLLSRALDPFNAIMREQAQAAGFAAAQVERDLTLTYNGRAYALCSESEQWRADALFAVAIATLGNVNAVMLDRFDVLAPAHRGAVIKWLSGLARDGMTVFLAATLKAKPEAPGIDVVWLQREGAALQAAA